MGRVISIKQQGNCLAINPWPDYLQPSCTGQKMSMRPMGPAEWAIYHKLPAAKQRGYKFINTPFPLYEMAADGVTCYTYYGLLTRILERIRRNGDQPLLEVVSHYHVPDFSKLEGVEWRPGQLDDFTELMGDHCGLLRWPPGVGKSQMIVAMAKAYLGERFLVVCSGITLLKQIRERLEKVGMKASLVCSGGTGFKPDRSLCVCSADSLHRIPSDWPTLLLMDEVQGAGSLRRMQQLAQFQRARMFGMSATPLSRGDGTNRCVEALFGPIRVEMTYDEAVGHGNILPIEIWRVDFGMGHQPLRLDNDVALRRHGIWRNQARNRHIAAYVQSLLQNGCQQLLISVKTNEHGLFLRQHLPRFTLVHGKIDTEDAEYFGKLNLLRPDEVLEPDVDAMRHDFKEQRLRLAITTSCWWVGVDFPNLSYLFRADGEGSDISSEQLGGRVDRVNPGAGKDTAVMIDLYDHHHPVFEKFSKKRFENYAALGWSVAPWG